jgi:phage-related protein
VATGAGLVTTGIGSVSEGLTNTVDQANQAIADALKPVSGFMGATLFSLTNVMKDPLGALTDLPNTIRPVLDAISPTLYSNFVGTYKNHNLSKIFEIPGQVVGSIQSFIGLTDKILAIPLQLISDLYAGLQELMGIINDAINAIFDSIQKFLVSMIDSLLPGLTDFLSQLSIFANQIGSIATVFMGVNQITQFTNNLINITNTLNGIVQNPLDFAFSLLPPSVSEGIYLIQNPQQIINDLLSQVPEVNNFLGSISQITGYGLNGNMGYGLQSVLQGVQGGVLAGILNGFSTQFSILAPLFTGLAGGNTGPQGFSNSTTPISTPGGPTYSKGNTGGNIVQTQTPQSNYNNPVPVPAGPCWVAREVYGIDNIQWVIFRDWLFKDTGPKWLQNTYIKYGQQFAKCIRNKPAIKTIIRKLMDIAIKY